jgi:hypothetical protein
MEESQSLRQAGVERGAAVRFLFDGEPVAAYRGESVASALLAAGHRALRFSPRAGEPRGAFCLMGLCQECTVLADGVRQPACRLEARDGMVVVSGSLR